MRECNKRELPRPDERLRAMFNCRSPIKRLRLKLCDRPDGCRCYGWDDLREDAMFVGAYSLVCSGLLFSVWIFVEAIWYVHWR